MSTLPPQIRTHHTHLPSPLPQSPSFQFHVTRLIDTLFIWVGAAPATAVSLQEMRMRAASDPAAGEAQVAQGGMAGLAGLTGDDEEPRGEAEKRVAGDWAVSMPVRANIPPVSTPLFRSSTSDLAEPMSQRIARKFPSNQIHLSLSLPPTLTAPSGPSLDPFASRTLLMMEKELGKWVEEVLAEEKHS